MNESQKEEIEVLESIIEPENLKIFDNKTKTTIKITFSNIDLTNNPIKINLNNNKIKNFSLTKLPNIVVKFVVDESYPETSSPKISISTENIDYLDFCSVQTYIDGPINDICNENLENQLPVIFDVYSEIQERIYELESAPDDCPLKIKNDCPKTASALKSFEARKNLENFETTLQECMICYSEILGSNLVPCQHKKLEEAHYFCKDCLVQFWKTGLEDKESWNLDNGENGSKLPLCPYSNEHDEFGNHILLSMAQLQNPLIFTDREVYEKFDKHLLNSVLGQDRNIICPKISCGRIIYLESSVESSRNSPIKDIECPHCHHYFCTSCNRAAHQPNSCESLLSWQQILSTKIPLGKEESYGMSKAQKEAIYKSWLTLVLKKFVYLREDAIITKSDQEELVKESPDSKMIDLSGMTKGQLFDILREAFGKEYFNEVILGNKFEELSMKTIQKTCLACPKCYVPIEKDWGCEKMTCKNCDHEFHYERQGIRPMMMGDRSKRMKKKFDDNNQGRRLKY